MRGVILSALLATSMAAVCTNLQLDGGKWHEKGQPKYDCAAYEKRPADCVKYGTSKKSENGGMVAADACCVCGGGTFGTYYKADKSSAGKDITCATNHLWKDDKTGETCADFAPGGKSAAQSCEASPAFYCCSCTQKITDDCVDYTNKDGSPWHETPKKYAKYNCIYYSNPKNCKKYGNKYKGDNGKTAAQSCCKCGGGIKLNPDLSTCTGCERGKQSATCPEPDKCLGEPNKDDKSLSNYFVGQIYKHKKHLAGDYLLYWTTNVSANHIDVGILGPPGSATGQWLGLGFTTLGGMVGSDAVVAWMDDDGKAVIGDYFMQNQSPSGVKLLKRQNIHMTGLLKLDDRLGLTFRRPLGGEEAFDGKTFFYGDDCNAECGECKAGTYPVEAGTCVYTAPADDLEWMLYVRPEADCQWTSEKTPASRWYVYGEYESAGTGKKEKTVLPPECSAPIGAVLPLSCCANGAIDHPAYYEDMGLGCREDPTIPGYIEGLTCGISPIFTTDVTKITYGKGPYNKKCSPFCPHSAQDRFLANIFFTEPRGMTSYELNVGNQGEPCQGPAKLECKGGLSCVHPEENDQFAANFDSYGVCQTPEQMGLGSEPTGPTNDDQTVFANGGGFQSAKKLEGGFTLLWAVDQEKPDKIGKNDKITIALVSARPDKQGWISVGLSPNGDMKGSDTIIGWVSDDGTPYIDDFHLSIQVPSLRAPDRRQNAEDMQVIKKNGQTAIRFTRPLIPRDSVQLIPGDMHIIYASGSDAPDPANSFNEVFISYHNFRYSAEVPFIVEAEDEAEKSAFGMMALCGGEIKGKCKKDLICNLIPDEIKPMMKNMDMKGFTSANNWKAGANPFSQLESLENVGVCVSKEMAEQWAKMNPADIGKSPEIDMNEWTGHKKLRWGVDLYWKLLEGQQIRIMLITPAFRPGWFGVGMGTSGGMLGGTAVIGWNDGGAPRVAEYDMKGKFPWEVLEFEDGGRNSGFGQEAYNMKFEKDGQLQKLTYDRPMTPAKDFAKIVPGPMSLMIAEGPLPRPSDDYIGYHRFRDAFEVTFVPI